MKTVHCSVFVIGIFLSVMPLLYGVQRVGLWHLIDAEGQGTLCYLHSTGNGWKVYDSDWTDLGLKVTQQGESISFSLPVQGSTVPLQVEGTFSGTDLKGKFSRFHVQYSLHGVWKTRFLAVAGDWTPLGWTRSLGDVDAVDIGALLVKRIPFSGKREFVDFWEKRIESKFYPILTTALYGDYRGAYLDHLRVERVNQLFKSLSEGGEARRWLEFEKRFRQVQSNLGRVYPWMNQRMKTVSLPRGGLFDFRFIRLNRGRERVLVFDVDWWARHCHDATANYVIGQAIIYGQGRILTNLPENLRIEIARRGIAAYLANKLAYSDQASDALFIGREDPAKLEAAFSEFKRKVAAVRLFQWKDFHRYFLGAKRNESYFLGYQFAASLAREFSPSEMLGIHFTIAIRKMNEFLSHEQAELVSIS